MMDNLTKSFQISALCMAMSFVSSATFAIESLEALDDYSLAEATGEGVAILPQDFSLRTHSKDWNNTVSTTSNTIDTGYIHLIPVGPLKGNKRTGAGTGASPYVYTPNYTYDGTSEVYNSKGEVLKKAEIYLYGLAISQSNAAVDAALDSSHWGTPFGKNIDSWGSATNPWILRAATNNNVPDFTGANKSVAYLSLEAPLYDKVRPTTGAEASAYNLKLSLWTDIYQRDADKLSTNNAGLSNRLRLGLNWDSFSINGSNIKIFQTLGGVTAAMGGKYFDSASSPHYQKFNYGLSTSYNNTLGVSLLARFNSGPTDNTRATTSISRIDRSIHQVDYNPKTGVYTEVATALKSSTASGTGLGLTAAPFTLTTSEYNTVNGSQGVLTTYVPMTNKPNVLGNQSGNAAYAHYGREGDYGGASTWGYFYPGEFNSGGICTFAAPLTNQTNSGNNNGQCHTQEGFTTRRFKVSTVNNWTPPSFKSVFRINAQELASAVTALADTPALHGGKAPNMGANADHVVAGGGATTGPQVKGAEGLFLYDMNINLVLGNLYQPLMFSTDGNNFSIELARIPNVPAIYRNIYQRYEYIDPSTGSNAVDAGVTYLGSTCNIYQCGTYYADGTSQEVKDRYQASTATHSSITIGATDRVNSRVVNGITYNNVNQLEAHKGVGTYGISLGELKAGTDLKRAVSQDYTQVWSRSRNTDTVRIYTDRCGFIITWDCDAVDLYNTNWSAWTAVTPKTPVTGQPHASLNRANPTETTHLQNFNGQKIGIQTTMPSNSNIASTINNMTPSPATVSNNFGSAAIDGLLIQHFKFSTTGL